MVCNKNIMVELTGYSDNKFFESLFLNSFSSLETFVRYKYLDYAL